MLSLQSARDKLVDVAKRKSNVKPSILVLDDNRDITKLLAEGLRMDNFADVYEAYTISGAWGFKVRFDVLIVDIYLEGDRGDMFVKEYVRRYPSAKVLLITGKKIPPGEKALRKPFNMEVLLDRVKALLK
jgi:DNA-binding response OmpR family regulator